MPGFVLDVSAIGSASLMLSSSTQSCSALTILIALIFARNKYIIKFIDAERDRQIHTDRQYNDLLVIFSNNWID